MLEIGVPSVLAQIPRPLSSDDKTWFSPVFSVKDSRKVKRQEFIVAVDGVTTNIYDVCYIIFTLACIAQTSGYANRSKGPNISSSPVPCRATAILFYMLT